MVNAEPTVAVLALGIFLVLLAGAIGLVFFRGSGPATKVVGVCLLLAFILVPFFAFFSASEVRRSDDRLLHYNAISVQNPSLPDFTAHDEYVADVYSSGEEAAKSLARQLGAMIKDSSPSTPPTVQIDREQSVKAGRDINETASILDAFQQQVKQNTFHTQRQSSEAILVTLRGRPGEGEDTQTLSVAFELHGDQRELAANFATDKIWVRKPSEFGQTPGAPRKFFVVGGPGSFEDDSQVIRQAAATIEPLVHANWYQVASGVMLDEDIFVELARQLVTDRFAQRYVRTIAGTPLDPPDQQLFLLMDYSDARVANALQSVAASRVSAKTAGIPPTSLVSWRSMFANIGSMGILGLLVVVIHFALQAVTRKFDQRERMVATELRT